MEWAYEKVEEVEKLIIYNCFIFCREKEQRNFWVLLWRGRSKDKFGYKGGFFRVKKNTTCLYVDGNDHVEKEKMMVCERVNNYRTFISGSHVGGP